MFITKPAQICIILIMAAALTFSAGVWTPAPAQEMSAPMMSSKWFDWSDYRADAGFRMFMGGLSSGHVKAGATERSLQGAMGFSRGPELFKEFYGILYIDRLGIRFYYDDHNFEGRDPNRVVHQFNLGLFRAGIDLDLVRYPFARLGVGCDYYFGDVVFTSHYDNTNPALNGTEGRYESKGPLTLGVHGSAIPMRFRDAPVTLKARVNFPIPYLQRKCESRSVDWEISAGLRPAIWDTSLYGYGHFNFSFEAGFRSIDMSGSASRTGGSAQASYTPVSGQIDYRAKWEGAFLQLGLAF